MTREEAEILVGTLIACVNEAHAAVSAGWRDSCWNAVDAAERQVVLALVGVQPAPSVQDVPKSLKPVINWLRSGCDPMRAADDLELIAAVLEAKP